MGFEIQIVDNTPLVGEEDPKKVAERFLQQIGYLNPSSSGEIPFQLFMDCFMQRPERAWEVDELAEKLDTSRPTIYRHLNKLKRLELLEEVNADDNNGKKGYRIRYGDLSKAWNFAEAHVKVGLENYRKTVDHLQDLLEEQRRGARSEA